MEVYRPSAKIQGNKSAKPCFTKENERDAVECVSCGKWRCVNDQMKRQYKVVNPVCQVCAENGGKPIFSVPKTLLAAAGGKKNKS